MIRTRAPPQAAPQRAAQAAGSAADGWKSRRSRRGSQGGMTASGGAAASAGTTATAGSAGKPSAGESSGPPPAVDGQSVYALECHGDSKDCNLATVPCFGVEQSNSRMSPPAGRAPIAAPPMPIARTLPSGAEAQASCVPFTSASHCMLVCQNENQSFACPDGMTCHVPPKSPIGYCLWQ